MAQDKVFKGSCFCGAVEVSVKGEPAGMGYCHCSSCREWSAAPINGFTLWKTGDVDVQKGEDKLGTFHKTEKSFRKYCKECGGHVLTVHPEWGLTDVYAAVIHDFPFQPQLHVNYGEKVMAIKDGLPKMRDLPKEMGGSGMTLAE